MKRIYFLAFILPVILYSCDKVPVAKFSIDIEHPEVGQAVYFNNNSDHADSYSWDFGDGATSTAENPTHIFTGSGLFTVTLTAYNSGMEDNASMDIEVLIPTLLEVDVFEWNDQYNFDNPISGASVWLYPDLTSWDNEINHVAEGFTDGDGVVVFSNLEAQHYYVDVWHEFYNNYTLRDEDPGWIETDVIVPNKINWFIAWVDYSVGKGVMTGRRGGSYVIKRLDRKVVDAKLPLKDTDWQVLYDRSIKVK